MSSRTDMANKKKGFETDIIQQRHEQQHEEEEFLHLDELVIEAILLRLPPKSVLRFKCVSKLWFSLLTHPTFVANYPTLKHRSSLLVIPPSSNFLDLKNPHRWDRRIMMIDTNKPPTSRASIVNPIDLPYTVNVVTNVVNGLICFYRKQPSQDPIYLYNITTREKLQISPTPLPTEDLLGHEFRLGFDPISEEYKLLHLWYSKSHAIDCRVLTLLCSNKKQTWRRIDISGIPKSLKFPSWWFEYCCSSALWLDGFLYWILYCCAPDYYMVMVFDVEHEKLGVIDVPQNKVDSLTLAQLRGQLSLVSIKYDHYNYLRDEQTLEITVWRLLDIKKDDGKPVWGKKEVILRTFPHRCRSDCNDFGVICLRISNQNSGVTTITGYDLLTRTSIKLEINNAQGVLLGYVDQFRPSKMVENIMPLNNFRET